MTSHERTIPDAQARHLAATTFDRNVVVVAGAGTGKTTLLVNRLVHLLMREPRPAPITQVVALTFTNKAATEMKVRLRERLMRLLTPDGGEGQGGDPGAVDVAELQERYSLSADRIAERAGAALRELEKAQIGTLHSFAAHLLRLYPIEGGVAPNFQEDDGLRFQEHFSAQWDLWLDRELGTQGSDHALWRRVLGWVGLDQIRGLAEALCSELVPLDELAEQVRDRQLTPPIRAWVSHKLARATALLTAHDRPKRRKAESMLAAARDLFSLVLEEGMEGGERLEAEARDWLEKELGSSPAGWSEDDFAELDGLIGIARRLLDVNHGLMGDLLSLLLPFVRLVRVRFLAEGWISFDGLLARARALLRDHPTVRERLKEEYQAVLVDEFQDTDPVQYEIVLYLSERPGRCASAWREVDLAPGKLFIVGDPKQSIYAFRRADIEAFEQVVNKIETSGGAVYRLVTNFRSHGKVLAVVNGVFDRLLRYRENVQPENVPLAVRPDRRDMTAHPGVELRLLRAEPDEQEEFDAAAATRHEADALARWLKEELLGRETLLDAKGRPAPLQPGHVAILFRKLTQAQDYLDALRRHDIPYVTDGEKHFYRRQEVIDLVNLLRVVENPHDTVALVGLLRSPLGGLTDREVYELSRREALDCRLVARLAGWDSPGAEAVRRLYGRLEALSRTLPLRSLPEALDLLFTELPVLDLAAASLHGEQAVANLAKVRQMAIELADRPHLTLTGFVDLMISRLSEQPEEAESALAEESLEAVRVLTIHKAKGLEFPVVILPGLHHGGNVGRDGPPVSHDWTTGLFGLAVGERCSLGAVLVGEKLRAREEAERRRVFYVGMTRAKERLILSGGLPKRPTRGSLLTLLREAVDGEVGQAGQQTVTVGPASLPQTVTTAPGRILRGRKRLRPSHRTAGLWTEVAGLWEKRDRAWVEACETPRYLSPSRLVQEREGEPQPRRPGSVPSGAEAARLIGVLAHRVLEEWDFAADPGRLSHLVRAVVRRSSQPGWTDDLVQLEGELQTLLTAFAGSKPYAELKRAEILAREAPFCIPWGKDGQVMEGVMDLVYRLDGRVWIADYKTDRVEPDELADRAARYGPQAAVYRAAVARCLGLADVGFQFIFLRNGVAVQV